MSNQSCAMKKVYYTKSQAFKALKEIGNKYGHKMFYYECPHCGWFHIANRDHELKIYKIKSTGIIFGR